MPPLPPTPSRRETLLGLAFMAGAFFFYATSDMFAKLLTETQHPIQVAWTRQCGLLTVVLVLLFRNGPGILRSNHPWLQVARGLTAAITPTSFIFAVAFVPLADAVAVSFVVPFLVTVLAALLLGERVGLRRWIAVALGFAGALIVIRPGMGVFHPAIFLVLITATAFALRQILSRMLSGGDTLLTTIAITGLTASLILSAALPFVWTVPDSGLTILIMVATAATAALAELGIIKALDLALAVVVAPVQYTLMIYSVFWGYLVFSDLPDGWTLFGAAIIMASGGYSLWRESRGQP